uniref:mitogen-activated protein kinase kinase n=1 Tax=Sander lucioperca TaxID=283035 RepID=A0A8D0CQH1_SANLU
MQHSAQEWAAQILSQRFYRKGMAGGLKVRRTSQQYTHMILGQDPLRKHWVRNTTKMAFMDNYLLGAVIGNGGYGTVYKATCLKTGQEFALKCYKRGVEYATVRELSCLSALQGQPHVIQMHDCFIHNGMMAMLMSYAPYTLADVIHSGLGRALEPIPLSFVARISVEVAHALSYMHGLHLVHRDLAPVNVLLTEDLTVKVADMGLSRHSSKWMTTLVVTEPYRAPELFVKDNFAQYTCTIDMWRSALGLQPHCHRIVDESGKASARG